MDNDRQGEMATMTLGFVGGPGDVLASRIAPRHCPVYQRTCLATRERPGAGRTSIADRLGSIARYLLVVALAASGLAHAQAWPAKPVRIVVPFSVGGTTDLLARVVGQALQQSTGQPFVIENKTGAGGAIGAMEVVRAPADGHTLLLATASTHSVGPAVSSKLPYNAVDDFTPIALLAEANTLLLVTPTLGVKSMNELLALARQKPGFLNYTSSGVGSWAHLTFELFRAQAGIDMTHVPYKGSGATITDLISGAVHMSWDAIPSGLPHVKEGRVRGLAVSGPRRSSLAPDTPTVGESVPGFSVVTWFGLYGPKGMSPDLTRRINEEINNVLRSPEIVARFERLGIEPSRGSSAEFAAYVAADRERWSRVVRERNIKAE
jgi:tripartite-type tricarboxylate transporter receptor subunit TctC